jgi:hypothetical protein
VYSKHSELFPNSGDVKETYWQLLQEVPLVGTLGVLARINNVLALSKEDPASHRTLHEQFLEPSIAKKVAQRVPGGTAFPVVFHRLSNIALMRNVVLYCSDRNSTTDARITLIGELELCTNDFVQTTPAFTDTPTNLQLAAQFVGAWDVYNTRDPAYALPRMHTILTEILPGDDRIVTRLRTRTGIDQLTIDTLTLPEFVAIVFGLFAYGNKVVEEGMKRVVLDPTVFLQEFPRAQRILGTFLEGRALTVDELAKKLDRGAPRTREQFLKDLTDRNAFTASLNVFRQHPLLRCDDGRIVILDLQAVTDLLTSGVYWLLYDGLPKLRRERFREIWGRAFELYVTDLMRAFYPPSAEMLRTDVQYADGQIDALLDFGPDVFVFEIKSSLLTEPAKRGSDLALLERDVVRKFVRNERGKPKGVLQLARAARAITGRIVSTAVAPTRIYSVLITDEPACECFAFNAYLNEPFVREMGDFRGVRPLTVMSIDEFEELLPYVANGTFSWAEVCEERFDGREVRVTSVHQATYDLRHQRGSDVQRNEYLLKRFEEIFQDILQTYRAEPSQTKEDQDLR